MKVEVLCSINSGQYNRGDIIEVDKKAGEALIKAGAVRLTKEAVTKKEPSVVEKPIPIHRNREE